MSEVQKIPEGFTAITPYLNIEDAAAAIEFYKKAFGAEEIFRMPGPGGKIMHAEITIGGARIMLTEANPEWGCPGPGALGGSSCAIHIYTEDADALFARAIEAGAEVGAPLEDAFWGDRFGKLKDPFGHVWSVATHIEDVSEEEMGERMAKAFADMPEGGGC